MIEMQLCTKKAKLIKKISELINEGKELTFIYGIGAVNTKDNEYFLNYIDYLAKNAYIKKSKNNTFYRMSKLIDRMTVKELEYEIFKLEKKIDIYRKMNDETRKALAISNRINELNELIRQYENKLNSNVENKIIYVKVIEKMKKEIEKLYNTLVS